MSIIEAFFLALATVIAIGALTIVFYLIAAMVDPLISSMGIVLLIALWAYIYYYNNRR